MEKIKADPNWVWAIAIFHAINGDSTLLDKLQLESIEVWIGDGI